MIIKICIYIYTYLKSTSILHTRTCTQVMRQHLPCMLSIHLPTLLYESRQLFHGKTNPNSRYKGKIREPSQW